MATTSSSCSQVKCWWKFHWQPWFVMIWGLTAWLSWTVVDWLCWFMWAFNQHWRWALCYLQRCGALNKVFRIVQCESDSLVALDLINHDQPPWHSYAALINSIKSFKNRLWVLSFNHVYREEEQYCVDWLAHMGSASSSDIFTVLDSSPHPLTAFLLADAMRVSFSRL